MVAGVVVALLAVAGGLTYAAVAAHSHGDSLVDRLVPAPDGSSRWPGEPPTEALDLTKAAARYDDPGAMANTLRQYGFVRGAIALWVTPAGTLTEIKLYQFGSAQSASDYFAETILGDSRSPWGKPFSIAGVPDAREFEISTVNQSGYLNGLYLAEHDDVVIAVSMGYRPPGDPAEGRSILVQQYARL